MGLPEDEDNFTALSGKAYIAPDSRDTKEGRRGSKSRYLDLENYEDAKLNNLIMN